MRGKRFMRKTGRLSMAIIVIAGLMTGGCLFGIVKEVDAASETAVANKTWSSVEKVIDRKLGESYSSVGQCTGYLYWCLKNAYGVDLGTNSVVRGLEGKLKDAGVTQVASGTSGTITSSMKPGDIIIFVDGTTPVHCAILGEGGKIYHATTSGGVINSMTLSQWMKLPDSAKNCDKYRVYRGLQSTGTLTITKVSSIRDTTDDNSCYSLKGAEYGLYSGGTKVASLVTDESGKASISGIQYGEYILKEITPSKGYALDTREYRVVIDRRSVTAVVKETPQTNLVETVLHKIDGEVHPEWSADNRGQFAATFEGAGYEVSYYDGYYENDEELESVKAERTWIVTTDESGQAILDEEHLVSGDEFYRSSSGQIALPLGTVAIQEVKAPEGYLSDDALHIAQVKPEGKEEAVDTYEIPLHGEQIIRGDLELIKIRGDSSGRLANVPFTLTSKSTGEIETIYTDANGQASTDGVWFGNEDAWDNHKGAMPYDTYILDEQPCEANEGLNLITGVEVVIYRDNKVVDMGTLTNEVAQSPEKPEAEERTVEVKPAQDKAPDTGDGAGKMILLVLAVMMTSAAIGVVAIKLT